MCSYVCKIMRLGQKRDPSAACTMSSTLPRTRSVSAASSSSSAASGSKERVRPVSLCDTSWARMTGQDLRQQNLVRTPSQANNLSTTVPQSLVVQNLGGRHTPTRSSLRHSRMIVLAKNGQKLRDRRWPPNSLGRVGVLVVTAQILVGVMAVTLAAWFLMWAPSLSFREVPHYAGVPVSVFTSTCTRTCPRRPTRRRAQPNTHTHAHAHARARAHAHAFDRYDDFMKFRLRQGKWGRKAKATLSTADVLQGCDFELKC
ncbi:uncharacterized protein LOC125043712 [Penaeus chinensis]|uniref:uncharacterized protein LOC125043712 n=1 Tax=Penaeus chinensis TaxID=139456 RepID=UPI001FB5A2B1|nr:uncharacterized protein LOC125043712 [Penaeus chinensis]